MLVGNDELGIPPQGNILTAYGSAANQELFGLGWNSGGTRYSANEELFGLGCDGKGCCDCEKGAWGKGLGCAGKKNCACGCSGLGDFSVGNVDLTYTLIAIGSTLALAGAGYLFYHSTKKGQYMFGTVTLAILGAKGLSASIPNVMRKG